MKAVRMAKNHVRTIAMKMCAIHHSSLVWRWRWLGPNKLQNTHVYTHTHTHARWYTTEIVIAKSNKFLYLNASSHSNNNNSNSRNLKIAYRTTQARIQLANSKQSKLVQTTTAAKKKLKPKNWIRQKTFRFTQEFSKWLQGNLIRFIVMCMPIFRLPLPSPPSQLYISFSFPF